MWVGAEVGVFIYFGAGATWPVLSTGPPGVTCRHTCRHRTSVISTTARSVETLSRTKRDAAFAGRESPADFITGEGPLTVEMKMGASRPFCWRVTPIPASSPSCWPPAVADHSEIQSSGVVINLAPCLGKGAEQVVVRGARSGVGGASVRQRAGMVVRRGYPWGEGGLGRATRLRSSALNYDYGVFNPLYLVFRCLPFDNLKRSAG